MGLVASGAMLFLSPILSGSNLQKYLVLCFKDRKGDALSSSTTTTTTTITTTTTTTITTTTTAIVVQQKQAPPQQVGAHCNYS